MIDELMQMLQKVMSFGITLDLWTYERTQIHYITVMIHFIDKDWMMNSSILATREMEGKKTGDNIRQTVDGVLKEFGIKMEQDDTTFVTDNGCNVVAALHAPIKWISCSGHNLNLVISNVFDDKSVDLQLLSTLLTAAKNIVTHAKYTGIHSQFDKTLKQPGRPTAGSLPSIMELIIKLIIVRLCLVFMLRNVARKC